MVEQQIRTWEVLDQDVLDLLYLVPREQFVPAEHRALAFSDLEIPLEAGKTAGERMWQPKMEARILQELNVHKTDRVLEVGTGSGYFTALLAHRCAQVCSVEINPALAEIGSPLERHRDHAGDFRPARAVARAQTIPGWKPFAALCSRNSRPRGGCSRWSAKRRR
jgi:protein-L-isoaspartate(D-aspartate) O-methyltransferase